MHLAMVIAGLAGLAIGIRSLWLKKASYFDDGLEGFEVTGTSAILTGLAGVFFGLLLIVVAVADYLGFTSVRPFLEIMKQVLEFG